MELYHRTLIKPTIHHLSLPMLLLAGHSKQQLDKPKQLVVIKDSFIQIYTYLSNKTNQNKYQFKQIYQQQLFSGIVAAAAISYQDPSYKIDFLLITLNNGKYQLFEWGQVSSKLILKDQNFIFSDQQHVEMGITKPQVGQYIAVNKMSKNSIQNYYIMIASTCGSYRIYCKRVTATGFRLYPLYLYKQTISPYQMRVFYQITPAHGDKLGLYYTLASQLSENQNYTNIYKIKFYDQDKFEQQRLPLIQDDKIQMIIPRSTDCLIALGRKNIYYTSKNKWASMKIPQMRPSQPISYTKRPLKDRRQQFILVNQFGDYFLISTQQNLPNVQISYIQTINPVYSIHAIQRNLMFVISHVQNSYLLQIIGKHKTEDRIEKTRAARQNKQQRQNQIVANPNNPYKQFQIVCSFGPSYVIRDMCLSNIQKSKNRQLFLSGGRPGSRSGFLSILKYGLKLQKKTSINSSYPFGLWVLKKNCSEIYHSYIVLSYQNKKTATYLFNNNFKLITTNQLRLDQSQVSLNIVRLADNSVVQVVPSRIKHIYNGQVRQISIGGRIQRATSVNEGRQLVLAFIGGDIEYYQLIAPGQLKLVSSFRLQSQTNVLEFFPPQIIEGKPFSKFLAICLSNYHVIIYMIKNRSIEQLHIRNIKGPAQSIATIVLPNSTYMSHIGTPNRVIKWNLAESGQQIKISQELVSQKVIKFNKITVLERTSIVRLNPQPTVSFYMQGQLLECIMPLPSLDHFCQITLDVYSQSYLHFYQAFGFDSLLNQKNMSIGGIGKRIVDLRDRLGILVQNKIVNKQKPQIQSILTKFQIYSINNEYYLQKQINFQDKKALSVAFVQTRDKNKYLCFGCSERFSVDKPSITQPIILVYHFAKNQKQLKVSYLYKFALDEAPVSMAAYYGGLLVGSETKLTYYHIFANKLVKMVEQDRYESPINNILCQGDKIFITQISKSFTLLRLSSNKKYFQKLGEDYIDRFVCCAHMLDGDYGVVAGGDKFGNFYVSKISAKMKFQCFQNQKTQDQEYKSEDRRYLLQSLVNYNIGQIITSIKSGRIDQRKKDMIFYTTINGRLGAFYPFQGDEQDIHYLKRLEQQLQKSTLTLISASNHKLTRNFYSPSKGVIDGDFCSLFDTLNEVDRNKIAGIIGLSSSEISSILYRYNSQYK